jgi:hypothetical protein
VTCLRSQVESKVTAASESVLDQQRDLVGEAELDRLGEAGGFAEVDEIFQREGQGDRFGEFDFDIELWLFDIVVASQSNSTISNITIAGELHTVFGGFDRDCGTIKLVN